MILDLDLEQRTDGRQRCAERRADPPLFSPDTDTVTRTDCNPSAELISKLKKKEEEEKTLYWSLLITRGSSSLPHTAAGSLRFQR